MDYEKSEQLFEQLARSHPDLIQKAKIESLGVGPGWYDLIDVLCGQIDAKANSLRMTLAYAKEKNRDDVDEIAAKLAEAIKELPVISDIKEKFGGLRFYVYGGTDEHYHYINFAESMSHHLCEECGDRGESRQGGWIKVRCDKHQKEHEAGEILQRAAFKKKIGPRLSDETPDEI